uniref:Salivary lipocalin n=1 Tax=Amblyomma variegatum TaxID=34610 RepID=F0J9W7_AMBVA|nr:TPA_inf: salivary lipocalin [Amblyomma variegatum]
MDVFGTLIFSLYFMKAQAERTPVCINGNLDSHSSDGFSLTQNGAKFRLVQTTATYVTKEAHRCITVEFANHNKEGHTVEVMLRYQGLPSARWYSYNRTFKFECKSGGYNEMTSDGETDIPVVSYEFLKMEQNCAILKDISPQVTLHAYVLPERRYSSSDRTELMRGDCMLWIDDKEDGPTEGCRTKLRRAL